MSEKSIDLEQIKLELCQAAIKLLRPVTFPDNGNESAALVKAEALRAEVATTVRGPWPKFFNPLFRKQNVVNRALIAADRATANSLDDLFAQLQQMRQRLDRLDGEIRGWPTRQDGDAQRSELSLIAWAESWKGPRAQAGLLINSPLEVEYDGNLAVHWVRTNERIIENPWVLTQLRRLSPGACVLDCGCVESLLSLEMASLGFEVIGTDQRPCIYEHPRFRFQQADICALPLPDNTLDAVVALSFIEHIGIGHYEDKIGQSLDMKAMRELHRVCKPGGLLILTTPFGVRASNHIHRIYDRPALDALLKDFKLDAIEFAIQQSNRAWSYPAVEQDAAVLPMDSAGRPQAVALVVARKSANP